jgi:hypothetical protein
MRVNWRKGFNRIFALAVLCWVIYVVFVYPGQQSGVTWRDFDRANKACLDLTIDPDETVREKVRETRDCLDAAKKDHWSYYEGTDFWNALRDRRHAVNYAVGVLFGQPGGMPTPERRFDWLGALIVLSLFVLPPALAYGLVEVVWRTVRWVVRGFRQQTG